VEYSNEQGCIAEGVGRVDRRTEVEQRSRRGQGVFLGRKMERGESLSVGRIGRLASSNQARHLRGFIGECRVMERGSTGRIHGYLDSWS
jgi:hypothetical protein